jgi:hypothetical protein
MLLAACGGAPRPMPTPSPPPAATARPTARPARAIAPAAGAVAPGRYAVRYAFTYESACSQSWDVTTWQGQLVLDLEPGGGARLEATVRSRSVHPGGRYEKPEEVCGWRGAWEPGDDGARLHLTLVEPAGQAHYACRADELHRGSAPEALEAACRPRAEQGLPVLACVGERVPWILRQLRAGPADGDRTQPFLFGAAGGVVVRVEDGMAIGARRFTLTHE